MAFNYYQGPQPDSLNPAYQMLLEAEMAKARALGGILDPFTAAIRGNRQEAMQSRELDIRQQGQQRGLDIEQQRVDQQRQQDETQLRQDEAFARAMAAINGTQMDAPPQRPAGPVFQGRTAGPVMRQQPTAESILSGGMQPDYGAMGPENSARFETIRGRRVDD